MLYQPPPPPPGADVQGAPGRAYGELVFPYDPWKDRFNWQHAFYGPDSRYASYMEELSRLDHQRTLEMIKAQSAPERLRAKQGSALMNALLPLLGTSFGWWSGGSGGGSSGGSGGGEPTGIPAPMEKVPVGPAWNQQQAKASAGMPRQRKLSSATSPGASNALLSALSGNA